MNTTIALRSLAGAVLIAAVAAGCGDEQGGAPARIPPPGAVQVPSQPPLGCGPTADHTHRNDAPKTHTTCSPEQLRNDDMQDVLGHHVTAGLCKQGSDTRGPDGDGTRRP